MDNTNQAIIESITEVINQSSDPLVIALEGGHFSTQSGPDNFSTQSLRLSIEIAESLVSLFSRKIRIVFVILVDDLGKVCSPETNTCSVDTAENSLVKPSLAPTLENILFQSHLYKPDKLLLTSEKTARNRGIQFFRKYIKEHSASTSDPQNTLKVQYDDGVEKLYFSAADGQDVVLADIQEWQWSAYCPLLMSQHYYDVHLKLSKLFPAITRHMLVDFSFIHDRYKVNKGAEITLTVFPLKTELHITNVCFGDENGEHITLDKF